jgi:hypothetical protein
MPAWARWSWFLIVSTVVDFLTMTGLHHFTSPSCTCYMRYFSQILSHKVTHHKEVTTNTHHLSRLSPSTTSLAIFGINTNHTSLAILKGSVVRVTAVTLACANLTPTVFVFLAVIGNTNTLSKYWTTYRSATDCELFQFLPQHGFPRRNAVRIL